MIDSDHHNPAFVSPFVARPTEIPDSDLNFEKGEIIYENNEV